MWSKLWELLVGILGSKEVARLKAELEAERAETGKARADLEAARETFRSLGLMTCGGDSLMVGESESAVTGKNVYVGPEVARRFREHAKALGIPLREWSPGGDYTP